MTKILNQIARIRAILDPYDSSPTECDGMTYVSSTILYKQNISHQVMYGKCSLAFVGCIEPHYWINLTGELKEYQIDYRCRLWLGNFSKIPHGIFKTIDFPAVNYTGVPINVKPLSEPVLQALLMPIPLEFFR